jgi:hypothetical protein
MLALLAEAGPGSVVAYLDADLAFFSDIKPIYDELGDRNILIHGHNFAPAYAAYAQSSGIFNVGLVAVRNSAEGIGCLTRWRAQNVEMCVLDPEQGYCGDQKYLDEWPSLYPGLVILRHVGGGVAPWNMEAHTATEQSGQVMIDGAPLIFFHYHALRVVLGARWPRWVAIPSIGYDAVEAVRRLIFQPYIRALRLAHRDLARAGLKQSSLRMPWKQLPGFVRRRKIVIG